MPTPTKGPRLGGSPAHERLLLANLATALFEHGRITTTETNAKRLRPLAERLITFAKRGDLHARRQVLTVVRDKSVVHTLFAEIGPRFAERAGGYTRIVKVGPRKGDNAPMAVIELVEAVTARQSVVGEAERSRGARFRRDRGATAGASSLAAATVEPASVASAVVGAEPVEPAVSGAEPVALAAPAQSTEQAVPTEPAQPAASGTSPATDETEAPATGRASAMSEEDQEPAS